MSTPASVNFTPFVSQTILWANRDAANAFFGSLSVTIGSENIPIATVDDYGSVKVGSLTPYAPAVVVPTWVTLNIDTTPVLIPSQQAFIDLQTKVDAMGAKLLELMTATELAGQILT